MEKLRTIDIKGKPYVLVNERVLEFRCRYGDKGQMLTELLKLEGEVGHRTCVFKTTIFVDGLPVATGYACENEDNGFINKTSFIENCETSSWGRALGNLGIGIDTSIASAEEVANAVLNQNKEPRCKWCDESKALYADGMNLLTSIESGVDYGVVKDKYLKIVKECGFSKQEVAADASKMLIVVEKIKEVVNGQI
jgi:hypothetical protein